LGRIRRSGSDYLMYTLLDSVVDRYFSILEILGEKIEKLEDSLLEDPSSAAVNEIYSIKRDLLEMRHAVWPLRQAVSSMARSDSPVISKDTTPFLNDLYDHIIQVIDTVETYREMVTGMMDLYLSSVSNRTNDVMKVLTIIATLFIPLTFIAGVYGMNFTYMPELDWKWSYPVIWAIMIGILTVMLAWFRKKKWL
jgi:magnesium transporter